MAAGIVVKHETSAQSSALLWTWWLQRWSATELFQHALLDLEGFSKHDVVCAYDLLYVGIAKEQDSYQRLIKNAHHARLRVLSEEEARKPGAHPSDEVILFLFDIEPLSMQQIAPEDDDNFEIFNGADRKKVIADAEKAFVKLLDPSYNVVKFHSYPKGDDGLYGQGLDNYTYALNENMRFQTANSMFRGAYSEQGFDNRQDTIMIEGDRVELLIADEQGAAPPAIVVL